MRAVAILLVVAFHAHVAPFRGGFIGVDVFFVVSGYLITAMLVKEAERTGRVSLIEFYARRAPTASRSIPGAPNHNLRFPVAVLSYRGKSVCGNRFCS
jgi:hypothetical protein